MKTIKNRVTAIPRDTQDESKGFIDYAFLIRVCVNSTPQAGFTPEEMRKRLKFLDVVGDDNQKEPTVKPEGDMKFEDSQIEHLKSLVKSAKWLFMHKDIIVFSDYIEALKVK